MRGVPKRKGEYETKKSFFVVDYCRVRFDLYS